MSIISYTLDSFRWKTQVLTENTARWYRYMDVTKFYSFLKHIVDVAIITDLRKELRFMQSFDLELNDLLKTISSVSPEELKSILQECTKNNGIMPDTDYPQLSEEEVMKIEVAGNALFHITK